MMKDGRPILSLGAAGGPTIISQTVLAIIRRIDFEMSPEECLALPRFHHQWRPDKLFIERPFPPEARAELTAQGHSLELVDAIGASQLIAWGEESGFTGAGEPRIAGFKRDHLVTTERARLIFAAASTKMCSRRRQSTHFSSSALAYGAPGEILLLRRGTLAWTDVNGYGVFHKPSRELDGGAVLPRGLHAGVHDPLGFERDLRPAWVRRARKREPGEGFEHSCLLRARMVVGVLVDAIDSCPRRHVELATRHGVLRVCNAEPTSRAEKRKHEVLYMKEPFALPRP